MTQTQARMGKLLTKQYLEEHHHTLRSIETQVGKMLQKNFCPLSAVFLSILIFFNVSVGVISLSRSAYGKANSVITMIVSAQDGGGLFALEHAKVNISVVAGLVAPPVFEQTQYYFTVSEDALRGAVVGIVQASSKTGRHSRNILYF